jgi:hypothetical protein
VNVPQTLGGQAQVTWKDAAKLRAANSAYIDKNTRQTGTTTISGPGLHSNIVRLSFEVRTSTKIKTPHARIMDSNVDDKLPYVSQFSQKLETNEYWRQAAAPAPPR